MFRCKGAVMDFSDGFPRASGDVPAKQSSLRRIVLFSPRERGCSREREARNGAK